MTVPRYDFSEFSKDYDILSKFSVIVLVDMGAGKSFIIRKDNDKFKSLLASYMEQGKYSLQSFSQDAEMICVLLDKIPII